MAPKGKHGSCTYARRAPLGLLTPLELGVSKDTP